MNLKQSLLVLALGLTLVYAASLKRNKRAAYELPDGIEFYLGNIRTTFQCPGAGYYADMDNNCQLFHVCIRHDFPDGRSELAQYSFACGNQTIFNQYSMTCSHEAESIPCQSSPDFYYLNELIGQPEQPLHREEDVARYSSYFGQRVGK
ncbi:uncharacterized protein LOC141851703 [Brevipalpus obovatus]|uniref:uncharacterized protein LOC141851703 n=1 Tax=Brevipalpus obovatus TaxID=246614 RepID=UPI003D9E3D63